jgi:formamidopyrimidine-DNA glycosylase
MPELPEVEATRRHLEPVLVGAVPARVEVLGGRLLRYQPLPGDFTARLKGRRIDHLARRGKFLLAGLEGGLTWVTHLGMSGRLAVAGVGTAEGLHTRLVVALADGPEVHFVDPRTFGFSAVLTAGEMAMAGPARLGPDALDELPPVGWLQARLSKRKAPVKAVLLDQGFLAGLGNIYADEVLHRAGIRPDRPALTLDAEEIARLRSAIRPVLESGLRHGGTSLADLAYLLPDGRAGRHLSRLRAYGREGLPCRRCRAPIQRMVLRNRSAFFCSECQI